MQQSKLERGASVDVIISEPWEFVTQMPSPRSSGVVLAMSSDDALVLQLDNVFRTEGESFARFLTFPRSADQHFNQEAGRVFCNFVSIDEAESVEEALRQPKDFRGKLMLLGDIVY